ncbi:MAG: M20/M25/M40 family metallo-hydrolase, partial [Clostridia bacterium]|nr:M20/M25/M40 family metallo-hydrolase [Clostridia bacterium]
GGAALPVNVPGVLPNKILAGIGIAEKGYADMEIVVNAKGGHSSQPPKHTALGIMATVIQDLEKHQFKSSFNDSMNQLLDTAARNLTFPVRLVSCNLPVLKPLILQIFKQIPPAACMVRTTTGVTMAEGSPAPNVLPQRAAINVNFRAVPGVSTQDLIDHIRKSVRYKNIEINVKESKLASIFSPTDSRAYKIIEELCSSINDNSMVVPFMVMGGTDAYNYEPICENIYRYGPFVVNTGLLLCTHATNERIPVKTMADGLKFFKNYIRRASAE